jgi:hypothetical protein
MSKFDAPSRPWTDHPEYHVWHSMRGRCSHTRSPQYHNYGGRGIKVCPEWDRAGGFEQFYRDMGPRPTDDHSIDRIDNDQGYSPENCRWATRLEQQYNRGDNKTPLEITYQGRMQPLFMWTEELGLDYDICRGRLEKGWSVEEAFGGVYRNKYRRSNQSSPFVGVYWEGRSDKKPWRAKVRLGGGVGIGKGKYKVLGRFATDKEAAIVRDLAVLADGRPLEDLNFQLSELLELSPRAREVAKAVGVIL